MNFKKITLLGIACLFPVLILFILGSCSFFPFSRGTSAVSPKLLVKGNFSNIETIALTVSGPGMRTIERTFKDTGNLSIEVPAGNSREFEMQVNINPADPGAALSYYGSATVDLIAGASVTIPLTMELYETKLLIPDPYLNWRLVQIDDMIGSNWTTILAANLTNITTFRPYDVDFDAQGRIYIANNNSIDDKIVRIDDMSTANEVLITDDSMADGIVAFTVDRKSDYLYYITDNDIYRQNINSFLDNILVSIAVEIPIRTLRGIAVDADGFLYLANDGVGDKSVYKVDPNALPGSRVVGSYSAGLLGPHDVMVKAPYLYVADPDPAGANDKIVQLTLDLSPVDTLSESVQHPMYGPRHFVAILNKRIYFMDELPTGSDADKLVAMDDIDGTNWETYGSFGSGVGEFVFYYGC
jgi:hypothetical protein